MIEVRVPGSTFEVLSSAPHRRAIWAQRANIEPRTLNNEPEPGTRTWNLEPGTGNRTVLFTAVAIFAMPNERTGRAPELARPVSSAGSRGRD